LQDELGKTQRLYLVGQAFRPAAPVDDLELFAGRDTQRGDTISAVSQRGYHVALYGERGVGKTSLARVLVAIFNTPNLPDFQAASVNCNTDDTFETIWTSIFGDLGVEPESVTPEGVRHTIARLDPPALIVIDELDRLEDDGALTLLADTIKTLSDHAVPSTVVLVGVASSMMELIGEHESIVRNLAQIEMPRMSRDELRGILSRSCGHAQLRIQPDAVETIVTLSEGLPHYTHLLGLKAGEHVVQNDRDEITMGDVNAAIPLAVRRHTIENDYLRAVRSSQPGNLYREVLLACAVVPKDALGYFTSGQIRDPLEIIAGRRLEIPAFSKHMNEFLGTTRGSVLRREGKPRAYSYRFSDPAMSPYVILNSLAEGLITHDQLTKIQGPPPTSDPDSSGLERLF